MKKVFFLLFLAVSFKGWSQYETKRMAYLSAGASDEGKRNFYTESQNYALQTPTDKAYKGVAIAMYASIAGSVADKFSIFSEGKNYIEQAVAADWYNPEIRFLRFSVQAEVPFIVGYSSNLKDDAYVVIDALEKRTIDPSAYFWSSAIRFMLNSGELSGDQYNRLSKFNS
jgi:hypothetical protein